MVKEKKLLSIIVPCHNEEDSLRLFFSEVTKYTPNLNVNVELIFIDDGSKDNTAGLLSELYAENRETIKAIFFSRNFGKESAILAGLEYSKGDYVVVMDADLQDPPELLPEMLRFIEEESYDIVATRRRSRKGEGAVVSFFSSAFYKLFNKFSDIEIKEGARDYKIMTRQVVNAILSLQENNRFSKGLTEWVGFNVKYLEFDNVQRQHGKTSWGFFKLFKYALDGIVSFSVTPLRVATVMGLIVSLLAFLYLIFVVIKTLTIGDPVAGYPSMIAIILLTAGVQLLFLGIIGEYLGKAFIEMKNRPKYIVKRTLDSSNDSK